MADTRICSIPNCDKPAYLRGWCCAHYARWQRNGDPEKTKARRPKPPCLVDGCGRLAKSHGYCGVHANRLARTGDPLGSIPRDKQAAWLRALIGHEGDECIFWPFRKGRHGYGLVSYGGKSVVATRLMARFAHGDPPDEAMHAAHSCHNGHLGCCNPNHLHWATPKENGEERRSSPRHVFGERHPKAVLTVADVETIRRLVASGVLTLGQAARRWNVHIGTVQSLVSGRTWRHVPLP